MLTCVCVCGGEGGQNALFKIATKQYFDTWFWCLNLALDFDTWFWRLNSYDKQTDEQTDNADPRVALRLKILSYGPMVTPFKNFLPSLMSDQPTSKHPLDLRKLRFVTLSFEKNKYFTNAIKGNVRINIIISLNKFYFNLICSHGLTLLSLTPCKNPKI